MGNPPSGFVKCSSDCLFNPSGDEDRESGLDNARSGSRNIACANFLAEFKSSHVAINKAMPPTRATILFLRSGFMLRFCTS